MEGDILAEPAPVLCPRCGQPSEANPRVFFDHNETCYRCLACRLFSSDTMNGEWVDADEFIRRKPAAAY